MYRLHPDLLCCISTYVDLVISNLWTIFWYTTYFCSFSFYVVGSSGETYHWCCNKEWVISEFLHFLCIYWQHTVCLFISFLFYCSHYCTTVSYTLRELFGHPQLRLKKYLCLKSLFVCSRLQLYVYHTVFFFLAHSVVFKQTGSYSRPESESFETQSSYS